MSKAATGGLNMQMPDEKGYFGEYGGMVLPPIW